MSIVGGMEQALREATDPRDILRRIVRGVLTLVPDAQGAMVEMVDSEGYLTCVSAAGNVEPHTGMRVPAHDSLAGLACRTRQIQRSDNAADDPRVDHESMRKTRAMSMVCVPLVRNSEPAGVLLVTSSRVAAFDDTHERVLAELAGFVSMVVQNASDVAKATTGLLSETGSPGTGAGSPKPGTVKAGARFDGLPETAGLAAVATFVADVLNPGIVNRVEIRDRVERTLAGAEFTMVYQPVVDLEDGRITAVEALARFHGPPMSTPDVWFADADSVGLGVELELAAIEAALVVLDALPLDVSLAVNVGPKAIGSHRFHELLEKAGAQRIIVELTEHIEISNYERLHTELVGVRRLGARLSIDDTGAGYASLTHILNLNPDFIKLDLALTKGIDSDPVRRALASALTDFARESGAKVVAEGIETAAALSTLQNLGAHYGQGYYLGRPGPIDALEVRTPSPRIPLANRRAPRHDLRPDRHPRNARRTLSQHRADIRAAPGWHPRRGPADTLGEGRPDSSGP